MSNEPKEDTVTRIMREISESGFLLEIQPAKVKFILELYFQERTIFPIKNGEDVASREEANNMTLFQQIELLEFIVGNPYFHQNLPAATIPHIEELLKKIDKEKFRT